MTFLTTLRQAAFWEQKFCLTCHSAVEAEDSHCDECGAEGAAEATSVLRAVEAGVTETLEDEPS